MSRNQRIILNKTNFIKFLKNNFHFENKPTVAVAVSGGPDSMVLLNLVSQWIKTVNGKLIALIVNHNLRAESKIETLLTSKNLQKNKTETIILNVKKNRINNRSMSEARTNRYDILTDYCNKNSILHLFLGHHKDDNLETFLNRKISGSDFEGLQSMKFVSLNSKIRIIRPLLNYSKIQILEFVNKNNITYFIDPSNTNLHYTRPVIRKFLNETDLSIKNEIIDEFKTVCQYSNFYSDMISDTLVANIIDANPNKIKVECKNFIKLDKLLLEKLIKKFYYFFFKNEKYIRSIKIKNLIIKILNTKFTMFNLRGMVVQKNKDFLIFTKKTN